jgi:tRNA-splicing ligase RtcB
MNQEELAKISGGHTKPLHLFVDQITVDQSTLHDLYEAMKIPYVVAGAAMPDMHKGYALPIGAVVATEGVIVPSWVGYDIGCGMCALPTNVFREEIEMHRTDLFEKIYECIPTGEGKGHANSKNWSALHDMDHTRIAYHVFAARNGAKQFGTLGGGNHFIEIGYDEHDRVWAIIHSGSRGFGHGLATEYMKLASGTNKAMEGHFPLAVDSELGRGYITDMNFALQYALDNRLAMLQQLENVFHRVVGSKFRFRWDALINRNHNHAVQKDGLWIHRKGATHAEEGMMGVIPGNMRDGAFIVRGKGNPNSLWSSSHGAGRVMGRKQAEREVNLDQFRESMVGITAKVEQGTIDESPFAYKDIFSVMDMQKDLVEVEHHIRPIINVKG